MNASEIPTSAETGIRIVRLNADKTRHVGRAEGGYDIYFELSPAPPAVWRSIFDAEWKGLNPDDPQQWERVTVDNKFLILQAALSDVREKYLPLLEKAVANTNASFIAYTQKAAEAQTGREDVWKEEREEVDRFAGTLRFGGKNAPGNGPE
jgi:hypothetical protein